MQPTFEYCSLKYLDIYQQFDNNLIAGFKGVSRTYRLEILKNAAIYLKTTIQNRNIIK